MHLCLLPENSLMCFSDLLGLTDIKKRKRGMDLSLLPRHYIVLLSNKFKVEVMTGWSLFAWFLHVLVPYSACIKYKDMILSCIVTKNGIYACACVGIAKNRSIQIYTCT